MARLQLQTMVAVSNMTRQTMAIKAGMASSHMANSRDMERHQHQIMEPTSNTISSRADMADHQSRAASSMANNNLRTAKATTNSSNSELHQSLIRGERLLIRITVVNSNISTANNSNTVSKVAKKLHGATAHHHQAMPQTHTATTAIQPIQTTHKKASVASWVR